jgi:hypothetical protein
MADSYNCAAFRAGRETPVLGPVDDLDECVCACHEELEREVMEALEEGDTDFDRNTCPGCGGNCQTACR